MAVNNKVKRKQCDEGEFTAFIQEVALALIDDQVSLVTTGDLQNTSGAISTRLIQTGRDLDRMIRDFSGTFVDTGRAVDLRIDFLEGLTGTTVYTSQTGQFLSVESGRAVDLRLDFIEGLSGNFLRQWTGVVPTATGSPGNSGEFKWDYDYFYVAVADNNWKRTPLASW